MVTFPNEWKILEWEEKPRLNNQPTKKKRKEKKNLKQNAEVKSPQGLIPWVENVELKNLHILFT